MAATATAYQTVRALLAELKQHHVETVAMVANLPPGFLARKNSYWQLAYNLLEAPSDASC